MTFFAKTISFAGETVINASKAYTGYGFTPKVVIFHATRQTGTDAWTPNQAIGLGWGATTGATANHSSMSVSRGNAVPETHRTSSATSCIALTNMNTNSIDGEATLVSFDADGFTLNWSNAYGSAWQIVALALGGTDITNAKVIEWTEAGNTQIVPGVGFQPDLVFHFWNGANTNGSSSRASEFVGVMNATGDQWAGMGLSLANTQKGRIFRTDRCIAVDATEGGPVMNAHFTSMDADGFTVTWDSNPPPSDLQLIKSVCLKGTFQSKITAFAKSVSAAPVTDTVSAGFVPSAALLWSAQKTTGTSTDTVANRVGVGWYDGTNERAYAYVDQDSANPAQCFSNLSTTKAFVKNNSNGGTTQAEADGAFSGNNLQLTWTTNDAEATQIGVLLLGAGGGGTSTTATPATVAAVASVPSVTDTTGTTATPATVAAVAAVPDVAIVANVPVATFPGTVAVVAAVPDATIKTGSKVSVAVVVAVANVPTTSPAIEGLDEPTGALGGGAAAGFSSPQEFTPPRRKWPNRGGSTFEGPGSQGSGG